VNRDPEVVIWGSGEPKREFLYVDDLADACFFLMQNYNEPGLVNVGTGKDLTIMELAELIQRITGYEGSIRRDPSKPDGTPRKLLDVSKLEGLGWKAAVSLEVGIRAVYAAYKKDAAAV
jgi:GDP-L-fucose synthase